MNQLGSNDGEIAFGWGLGRKISAPYRAHAKIYQAKRLRFSLAQYYKDPSQKPQLGEDE